jgi:hypothetical protein
MDYKDHLETSTLVGGQVINAHPRNKCYGYWCPVHYPSPHHMRDWPQNWRSDRGIMERMCPDGVGHPDPDDIKSMDEYESIHGCDGCCSRPFDIEGDATK